MSIGLFVVSASQIFFQFMELTDLMKGTFMGIGIGLISTSIIFGNFKTI